MLRSSSKSPRRAVHALIGVLIVGIVAIGPARARGDEEFFEKHVRPLLVKRCYACHSGATTKGGLSLETRSGWQRGGESGAAIVPGKPADSLLIDAVNYRSLEMPPPDKGGKLSAAEIAVLTKWVSLGAPDPRDGESKLGGMTAEQAKTWWAFQPLPAAEHDPSPQQIDQFLEATLKARGLAAGPPADKRTLIRRATYDLTGLPPTAAEVDAFLADDSPTAFAKVVDRLLDSPQYGVRWGRHWLDVARYADTAGENTDRPLPHAWRYRNWVIESFNRDLPYDEFVRLQIAGDILRADEKDRREGIIATGYLAVARRFGHDIDKDIHLMHEDVIDNLGKSFLGLALGCARCHDHKYDPVSSADYYALYGIFNSTKFAFPGCEPQGQPRDLVPLIDPAEAERIQAEHAKKLAAYKQAQQRPERIAREVKQIAAKAVHVLAQGNVPETQGVEISAPDGVLDKVAIKRGEVLQLAVLPNAGHGADSTLLELEITRQGDTPRTWSVAGLIPRVAKEGPLFEDDGAAWCLLDVTDGPKFLRQQVKTLDGRADLSAWRNNDSTPSAFATTSDQPVAVWTTLPARTFFVHPGPKDTVAVAWICGEDGEYQVRGRVADAHPAPGLDGVSFRLDHFASAEVGAGLRRAAEAGVSTPEPEPPVIPVAYAVVEGEARDAALQERGDPKQSREEVPRRWLSVFGAEPVANNAGSGRRQLADWVAASPLAARVIANRLWQWHFGHGLVRTPNNFGARGQAPTHPELLDYLASQLKAGGCRIKPMHRLIMNSAAYQRSSDADGKTLEADPENRLLARFSKRRLTAEEIRDSLLTASGRLDLSPGEAHPFPPEATWSFTQHNPFTAVYETNRRSAYLMTQRQRRHPYLALFDGADPNSSTGVRQTTTAPTQALYFMNNPFFHTQAGGLSQRVLELNGRRERIDGAFRLVFQRPPTQHERQLAAGFLEKYPGSVEEKWAAYARVLLASNEFLHLD